MLTPVFPLPEKSQKEYSLSKQLIQDLDYSIPLIPHSHLKLRSFEPTPWSLRQNRSNSVISRRKSCFWWKIFKIHN